MWFFKFFLKMIYQTATAIALSPLIEPTKPSYLQASQRQLFRPHATEKLRRKTMAVQRRAILESGLVAQHVHPIRQHLLRAQQQHTASVDLPTRRRLLCDLGSRMDSRRYPDGHQPGADCRIDYRQDWLDFPPLNSPLHRKPDASPIALAISLALPGFSRGTERSAGERQSHAKAPPPESRKCRRPAVHDPRADS